MRTTSTFRRSTARASASTGSSICSKTPAPTLTIGRPITSSNHQGLALRPFARRFELADYVLVEGAKLENGLLVIDLKKEIPEEMKPRRIAMTAGCRRPFRSRSKATKQPSRGVELHFPTGDAAVAYAERQKLNCTVANDRWPSALVSVKGKL